MKSCKKISIFFLYIVLFNQATNVDASKTNITYSVENRARWNDNKKDNAINSILFDLSQICTKNLDHKNLHTHLHFSTHSTINGSLQKDYIAMTIMLSEKIVARNFYTVKDHQTRLYK